MKLCSIESERRIRVVLSLPSIIWAKMAISLLKILQTVPIRPPPVFHIFSCRVEHLGLGLSPLCPPVPPKLVLQIAAAVCIALLCRWCRGYILQLVHPRLAWKVGLRSEFSSLSRSFRKPWSW